MVIRFFCSFVLLIFSSVALASSPKTVTHVVTEDETAWFLAQVYYGKGNQYPKLLTANNLTRPEEIKTGMEIKIENPKYFKGQTQFGVRYIEIWEQRQKALGLKAGSPLPHAKVVIPIERIRNQDQTPNLPFTETQVPDDVLKNSDLSRHPAEQAGAEGS